MYFQKSYEPKRETSKSKKCEILEDSLHRVTLSAPEKKIPNGPFKKTLLCILNHLATTLRNNIFCEIYPENPPKILDSQKIIENIHLWWAKNLKLICIRFR